MFQNSEDGFRFNSLINNTYISCYPNSKGLLWRNECFLLFGEIHLMFWPNPIHAVWTVQLILACLSSLTGFRCCLLCLHSAPSPGSVTISPTSTPSLVSQVWPPNMATAAPAAPRENGPLFSFLLWIPSKIPWSPHRASSCHLLTHSLTSRGGPSWGKCLWTPIIHKLLCQILYRKCKRKWRRERRESWLCCLWGGETHLPLHEEKSHV